MGSRVKVRGSEGPFVGLRVIFRVWEVAVVNEVVGVVF